MQVGAGRTLRPQRRYGRLQMFVVDLRHYLDLPDDVPGPARRMADHLSRIVRAATAGEAGVSWVSALPCSRRPGRRPCPGNLALVRTEVPPAIDWRCMACGDDGVIRGWERSPFDLRVHGGPTSSIGVVCAVVTPEVTATLRTLVALDPDAERLVFRATVAEEGVELTGPLEAFDELLDGLAAEANAEEDRRRRKRVDDAFDLITASLGLGSQP